MLWDTSVGSDICGGFLDKDYLGMGFFLTINAKNNIKNLGLFKNPFYISYILFQLVWALIYYICWLIYVKVIQLNKSGENM